MPDFDYSVTVAVAIPNGKPAERRFVLRRGRVSAPEGEGQGYGLEAIAAALEEEAGKLRAKGKEAEAA